MFLKILFFRLVTATMAIIRRDRDFDLEGGFLHLKSLGILMFQLSLLLAPWQSALSPV
jgi:hypothetical protein